MTLIRFPASYTISLDFVWKRATAPFLTTGRALALMPRVTLTGQRPRRWPADWVSELADGAVAGAAGSR